MQDDDGGAVYLRLSTRPLEQPEREMSQNLRNDVINGGYWVNPPSSETRVIIVYSGVIAAEVFYFILNFIGQ